MKKELINYFVRIVNKLSLPYMYDWSPNLCKREIKEAFDKFYELLRMEDVGKLIDFQNLTIETAKELGFQNRSDISNLYLLPMWILPLVPIGTELISIFGESVLYDGNNIDIDTRGGYLAYGMIIKPERIP